MGPSTIHVLHLASANGAAAIDGERIFYTCRGLENHGGTREFRGSVAIIRPARAKARWSEAARRIGVDCYEARRFGPCDPTLWFRLGRFIKRLSIDIVHTYDRESRFWALVLQPRFRFRTVAKAFEPDAHTWGERLSREIDHKLLPGFDRVIAANAQLAQQLCQLGCRLNQIDVIPEATDEIAAEFDARAAATLRRQLVIPDIAPIVGLYFDGATLEEVRRIAAAVQSAETSCGPVHALGIGPDIARAEVRATLIASGIAPRLRMYDIGDSLHGVCKTVNAMLCAGRQAGAGALTAHGHRTPVVATASTGVSGLRTSGAPAWVVADDVPDEIATALNQALASTRTERQDAATTALAPMHGESTDRLVVSYRKALLV
jgi:hypothetical protein